MAKLQRKRIIFYFLIIIWGSLLFWNWWQNQYVTYIVDEANTCINSISTAALGPTYEVRVKKSEAKAFVQQAKHNNQCIYEKRV